MYTSIRISGLAVLATLLITACTIDLPDLDPNTPAGGDMIILDIQELLVYTSNTVTEELQFDDSYNVEYDLGNDGSTDILFRYDGYCNPVIFSLPGGEVANDGPGTFGVPAYPFPLLLPVNGLSGGAYESTWLAPGSTWRVIKEFHASNDPFNSSCDAPYDLRNYFYPGQWYIPIRFPASGDEYFYGWVEVFVSDYDDADNNDFILFSRMGISQTPGERIRMGQE